MQGKAQCYDDLTGFEVKRQGGRHGMVFGHALPITPHSSPPVGTESLVTSSIPPPQLSYLTTQSPIAVPLSVIQPGTQLLSHCRLLREICQLPHIVYIIFRDD